MKLFIDTADVDQIREAHRWGILAGVTTNPSLIAKQGGNFIETIHEIAEIVDGPVSAETVAQDTAGMLREGRLLAKVHRNVIIKVPLTPDGLAACRVFTDEGIRVNVTLCFSATQALAAALAGAAYISPFMGRVDDIAWSGIDLIEQIVTVYENDDDITTQVLAASIRHPLHVQQSALAGAHVATVPFNVLAKMLKHPLTDSGNARFLADWATVPDNNITAQVESWLAKRG